MKEYDKHYINGWTWFFDGSSLYGYIVREDKKLERKKASYSLSH